MPKLKKKDMKGLLIEIGELCGREQRSTEPVLDFVDYCLNTLVYLSDDEYEVLSPRAKALVSRLNDMKDDHIDYRKQWTKFFKKFGYIFAEKNVMNAAERRVENEYRKGKPAGVRLMEIMLEDGINTSEGKLILKLQSEGYQYSKSTAHTIRSAFRQAVVVLADGGYLSKLPKL